MSGSTITSALTTRSRAMSAKGRLAATARALRLLWLRFQAWRLTRETRRVLAGLDDHQRRDIGLRSLSQASRAVIPASVLAWMR